MMQRWDLQGKVAIVTGGNGGIGLGMAEGLSAAGATVVIAARNADKSAAAVESILALGGKASAIGVDVTDEADCQVMVSSTVNAYGRLDILINNAGINIRKQPKDYTLTEWQQILQTNLTSAFLCSQADYPAMKRASKGKIINIGSMISIFGTAFTTPYAA